jgi:hypothetical protein
LEKQQLVRKGLLQRAKNHYQRAQHRVVLIETVFWKCRQKSARAWSATKKLFLAEANASTKRNLISVGGCTDTPVHVDTAGNSDGKRPCLDNGQTVLMRTPTQAEFVECWSEVIIRNGLPPGLVDDPLFRKALVTTSRMGQTAVCMAKGTALGKRDTTLPHRHTFTRKFVDWLDRQTNKTKDKTGNLKHVTDGFPIQFKVVKRLIMSDDFWDTLKVATQVLKPALVALRYCDGMKGDTLALLHSLLLLTQPILSPSRVWTKKSA